ncbi:MAG: ABC transporter ATP-binding protein [Clostridium sp.]|uniref:ABC transporter ATP-binding protein n=1 Tax=Clostridium culturomicium TaxID=1499683 RepID=UPI0029100AAD|nr:ABC transporter ATP-binding protein [Clostridium sp.]MDU7083659.1 ABC transporter ATP-binding protein [Clostridium sp.]
MKIYTDNIKVSYGAADILKGISVNTEAKEFIGIIGPNGSGKSTLLKCMYRTLKPDDGAVYLNGDPLLSMKVKESSKKIAVVAQHNYYNFDFSVKEVVLMGRSPHKKTLDRDNEEDYKIVEQALETVGMKSFEDRSFSTLSGGEQQKVILARALAQQTQCLILDEPTNHLDITHQLEILRIVKDLGITIVAAIHDLNLAAAYCDKLYVMRDGQIVCEGSPEEVLTRELIKEVYSIDIEIVRDCRGRMHILFV